MNTEALVSRGKGHGLQYILFLLGSFGMISIFYASLTFTPLYVMELGGNEFYAGLQNTLFLVIAVFLRFYFGPLGDARGRRIPLLIGGFVLATTPLAFYFSHSIPTLIAARIYEAIGAAAFLNTAASIAADFAPEGKIGTYMAGVLCLYPLSLTIAPVTAGYLLNTVGFSGVFLKGFIFGLIFFVLLLPIKYPVVQGQQDTENITGMFSRLLEAIKYKPAWLMLIGIMFVYTCLGAVLTYVPVYAVRVLDIDNAGVFFTYLGITGIIGTLVTGYLSDHWGRENTLIPSLLIYSFAVVILYFLPGNPEILILSGLLFGLGAYAGSGILQQWIAAISGEHIRATMMALSISAIDLSFALGTFIVGAAIGVLTIGQSLTILGLSVFAYAVFLIFRKYHGKQM